MFWLVTVQLEPSGCAAAVVAVQIFSWFTAVPVLCSIKGFQFTASLSHSSRYNDNTLCSCFVFSVGQIPQASRKFLWCSFIRASGPTSKKTKGRLNDALLRKFFAVATMLQLIDQKWQQGCKVLVEALLLDFAKVNYTPRLVVKLFTTIISLCWKCICNF